MSETLGCQQGFVGHQMYCQRCGQSGRVHKRFAASPLADVEGSPLPDQGITRGQAFELASEYERPILEIIFNNIGTIRTNRGALKAAREIVTRSLDASGEPLCSVHAHLERENKLEMEIGGNNCVACSLNERAELLRTLAPHVPVGGWVDSIGFLKLKLKMLSELSDRVDASGYVRGLEDALQIVETKWATVSVGKVSTDNQAEYERWHVAESIRALVISASGRDKMNDKLRRTKYGRALLVAAEDAYKNEIIDTEMENISIGENGDYASKDEWIEAKLHEWLRDDLFAQDSVLATCAKCGKNSECSMHGWCSDCILRLIADARNRTPPSQETK